MSPAAIYYNPWFDEARFRAIFYARVASGRVGTALANQNQNAYQQQLPKLRLISWQDAVNLLGALAGIVALGLTFFSPESWPIDAKSIIAMSYLFAIILLLGISLWIVSRKRLQRYAQATFFVHYVNHIIRDYLAELKHSKLNETVKESLNSIAGCFSIITGKNCRVCIKELLTDGQIKTVMRDSISDAQVVEQSNQAHLLEENTDFENLWYAENGCSRFYFSNNLKREWKAHRYKNSSFKYSGPPESFSWGSLTVIKWWPLNYKSAIVLPIRYIPDSTTWPPQRGNQSSAPTAKKPFVWGFLCIDCDSTAVFSQPYAAELGAAFADALFTLFRYQRVILDAQNSATKT